VGSFGGIAFMAVSRRHYGARCFTSKTPRDGIEIARKWKEPKNGKRPDWAGQALSSPGKRRALPPASRGERKARPFPTSRNPTWRFETAWQRGSSTDAAPNSPWPGMFDARFWDSVSNSVSRRWAATISRNQAQSDGFAEFSASVAARGRRQPVSVWTRSRL